MDNLKLAIETTDWERQGQLYVPKGAVLLEHQSVSDRMIKERLCHSDLTGEVIPIPEIIKMVGDIPKLSAIRFVSGISAALDRDGFTKQSVQLDLAKTLAHGSLRSLIIENVEKHNRMLFTHRTLMGLLKLAIIHGREKVIGDPNIAEKLVTINIALADHMDKEFAQGFQGSDQKKREAIIRWAVQGGDTAGGHDMVEVASRLWAVLNEKPSEAEKACGLSPTPASIFKAGTGIDLAEFMAVTFGIVVRYQNIDFSSSQSIDDNLIIDRNLFSSTTLQPDKALRFFKRLMFPKSVIRSLKKEDPTADNYFYDYAIFKRYPLYELRPDCYLPMFYPFFRWRTTEGLYWDVHSLAKKQKNTLCETFMGNFGKYFECYIRGIFEQALLNGGKVLRRMWADPRGGGSDPSPDLVLQYPGAYVFIETKAARFSYEDSILKGDWRKIQDDLRQMLYEPAEQLDRAIKRFCDGRLCLDGQTWKGERIYPVIITYGNFPNFYPAWEFLKQEVRERGFLTASHIHDLLVLNPYEAASLATCALKGISLVDVIREKTSQINDGLNFRNFIYEKYRHIKPREVIQRYWQEYAEFVRRSLFKGETP